MKKARRLRRKEVVLIEGSGLGGGWMDTFSIVCLL